MNINKQLIEQNPGVNFTLGRQGNHVEKIIIHTMVGTMAGSQARFENPAVQVTVHYGIGLNGEIREWIEEGNTAYQAGNWEINLRSIGIEHEDNGNYNDPTRTDAEYNSSSDLVSDICYRYSIDCNRDFILKHSEVIDKNAYPGGTSCCDGLDIDRIVRESQAKLSARQHPVAPPTTPFTVETIITKQFKLNKNPTDLWNLDQTTWAGLSDNPVSKTPEGTIINAVALAHHRLGGHYYLTSTEAHSGYNVSDCDPYSEPAPEVKAEPIVNNTVEVVAAPKATEISNIEYSLLESPQTLEVNKNPTHVWDLSFATDAQAQSVETLAQGTEFIAYGKAQRTDHDRPCYYMTEGDFGSANTSNVPTNNRGVNTVDLSPKAAITAVSAPSQPIVAQPTQVADPSTTEGQQIKVNVVPSNPTSWQDSYKSFPKPIDYTARTSVTIRDLSGLKPDVILSKDQKVLVAGKFTSADGVNYYRSKNSQDSNSWYGIPLISLGRPDKIDELLDEIVHEAGIIEQDIVSHISLLNRFKKR